MEQPKEHNPSLYLIYEARRARMRLWHEMGKMGVEAQQAWLNVAKKLGASEYFTGLASRILDANIELSERLTKEYERPEFGINEIKLNGETVSVREEIVEGQDKAFGSLLHFNKETDTQDPKVLLVAPMSGHYSTLLRDTVKEMLPNHDVYITAWKNAREVPLEEGDFGLEDYTDYVKDFIKELGPESNVVAVCQSTVPALAAVAHMSETEPGSEPATITLMGGPLDTRVAPTEVTKLAEEKPLEWFEKNLISIVPEGHPGAGRSVYPGFVQLTSFTAMNPERHQKSYRDLHRHIVNDDAAAADKIKAFYDEYCAVSDLSAQFYLDTVEKVFQKQELARGTMKHRGDQIDLGAITNTAVFTVEGEKDDISAPGQTYAIHEHLTGLSDEKRLNYLQEGVGHYGVFSGKKWRGDIAPRIGKFIRRQAKKNQPLAQVNKKKELSIDKVNGRS